MRLGPVVIAALTATLTGVVGAILGYLANHRELDVKMVETAVGIIGQESPMASFVNSGRFAINVLGTHQRRLSKHFSTPAHHKFTGIHLENGPGGCPVLPDSVANFECRTETMVDGGDHVIPIGRIERASYRDGHPLIFTAGRYREPSVLEEVV